MNAFQSKYPAFFALLGLVADAAKDTASALSSNASLLAKLLSYENLVPELIAALPQMGSLSAEIKAMTPADMEAAAEVLVSNLGFTSPKAVAVIAAALPVAEQVAALVAPVQSLVAVFKA